MRNVIKNEKGFTLLEVIVVLAVLGALAAMLSPVVFRYIDDANRARAQADTRTIATAIQRMYTDTSRWAFYTDGDGATAYTSGTDAAYLTSTDAAGCTLAAGTLTLCTPATLTYSSGLAGWTGISKAHRLTDHLVTNTPGYLVTGPRAWKGPYTDAIPTVDAWGNPYLVNIGGAGSTPTAVLVVSAGANGIVETTGNLAVTTNATPGGDDIISRVK